MITVAALEGFVVNAKCLVHVVYKCEIKANLSCFFPSRTLCLCAALVTSRVIINIGNRQIATITAHFGVGGGRENM